MPLAVLHGALGTVGVGRHDRRAHVLQPDAVLVERRRVEFDAHRGQRGSPHRHLPDAFQLRELLREDRRGRVVHLPLRKGLGSQRQDHDRRVGRVHLAIGRVVRQARRQQGARRVDGGLHVVGRAVDVAAEVELQRDARRPERARGSDLGDPGDPAQRPLEGRGHRRGHGLGARAGQLGSHRDGREIHLRQRRHRQQPECEDARQRDAQRQERRRDRALDEGLRQVHSPTPPSTMADLRRANRSNQR